MKIAIIGAGNVGGGLAAAAVKAGHEVTLSAQDPATLETAAHNAGARAAGSNADAVNGADLVVLAVPHGAVAAIVAELGDALTGKTLVDATNPLNDSYTDLTTSGVSAAEALQQQVPGAPVVKAFNTIFASRHANPTEGGAPLDAFVAGDDATAKATVGQLAESLGYRVIDAGSLRMARSLEEMAFLNISLNAGNGWSWQSGWKLVGPTASAG
jgi:NADPH-dependent F420 reductase